METQTIVSVIFPVGISFIMLGLGLSLKPEDFTRILKFPKPVLVGLSAQMLVMPMIALLLGHLFSLPPEFAIGLMILSASPGGATANIFSHLAGGDLALNLTLTAINSVLSSVTLPLIVGLSIHHFSGGNREIGFQFSKSIDVFLMILLPVILGMLLKSKYPALSKKSDLPLRIFSIIVLAVIIIGSVAKEWDTLSSHVRELGWVVLAFNLLSLSGGYFLPRLLKLSRPESISTAMEIGIHNATLAIYVSLSVLDNTLYALPAALYGVLMFFTASGLTLIFRKRS